MSVTENVRKLIDTLEQTQNLTLEEFEYIIENADNDDITYLGKKAEKVKISNYGNKIYIRGLIEISNYCKNNCLYCGIRCANENISRYRLSKEEILERCKMGYELGFRTFVMQGGEDNDFADTYLADIVREIKKLYPECAVTLSVGEREREVYQMFFDAGADRYLLRHETADNEHYNKLHPHSMSLEYRKNCLFNLKDIGFQTGCGFMVGSPYQTSRHLAKDMIFIKELNPEMVGIGPYITHKDTPFKDKKSGSLEKTLLMVGLTRLLLPKALIPATTALGTIKKGGREMGIKMGANVIMPNLSPNNTKKLYNLYDNKLSTGLESAENLESLKKQIAKTGHEIVTDRGDYNRGGNENV